jgi:transposase
VQVVFNRREKEQLVIKLHHEGKTIREIAAAAHLSFSDIGSIIRKTDGRDSGTNDIKNKSKDTQAIFLLSHGKKPIEVAVELDLTASEVHDIQEEYWALNDLHELAFVYNEIKAYLPSFLQLFRCLKKSEMLSEKQISNILKYVGDDLPELTDRIQYLRNEVVNLEDKKRDAMNQLIIWNAQLYDLGREIDIKNQQRKRMGK